MSQQESETYPTPTPTMLCTICCDELTVGGLSLPCEHVWCPKCLEILFSNVHTDRNWPVKCCENCTISASNARPYLSPDIFEHIKSKIEEFKTPIRERVYCSAQDCEAFIPPSYVQDSTATCQNCYNTTCTHCYKASHRGLCDDEPLEQMLELSAREGWQQCTSCGLVIDKIAGCNYMFCPCGYMFCYVCGCSGVNCICESTHLDDLEVERVEYAGPDSFVDGPQTAGFRQRALRETQLPDLWTSSRDEAPWMQNPLPGHDRDLNTNMEFYDGEDASPMADGIDSRPVHVLDKGPKSGKAPSHWAHTRFGI